jgi:hypothetical protein
LFEFVEEAVEIEHFGAGGVDEGEVLVQRDEYSARAFLAAFGTDLIDEHAAHQAGGEAKEVLTVFDAQAVLAEELQIEFVDQYGGLKKVSGALSA